MNFLGLNLTQWGDIGVALLIIILSAVVGRWLISFLLDRMIKGVTRRTKSKLDDALVSSIKWPLFWLILIGASQIGFARIDALLGEWKALLPDVFFILYLVLVTLTLRTLINVLANGFSDELAKRSGNALQKQWVPFIRRLGIILVAAIALTIALSHFDVDISGMIATLGIGSLAIALAAQNSLADGINGLLIMIDQPFRIGDRIEILDLDTWGDVVDIGLRSTRVRTRDNRMVIVPNSVIGKSLVVNYSYPDIRYRIQIHLGIAYGTDIEFARQTIIHAVQKVDGVLKDKPVEALFLEFGESALLFRVRWWIESYVDTRRMFDRVNSKIYQALEAAGIESPPPLREIHHRIDDENSQRLVQAFRERPSGEIDASDFAAKDR